MTLNDVDKRPARRDMYMVLAFAFLVRVAVVFVFPNVHHPDELFQALEPAHRLWTGWGTITWEWRDGIRSWIVPGFLAALMWMTGDLGPRVYLPFIHIVLASFSLIIVYVGYRLAESREGRVAAAFVGFVCAIWPDLIYFAGKSLTEAMAAPFLALACLLASGPDDRRLDRRRLMAIGFLLGLSFSLRFHLAPGLFVVACWACRLDVRRGWTWLLAGALCPILVFGVTDWATLGTPFQSIWKNFWANIVVDRSAAYGVFGPLFFPERALHAWGPAALALAIGFVVGVRKAPLFGLCAAVIWLTFTLVPHKEYRFVYPATPLIVIVAALGWARLFATWAGDAPTRRSTSLAFAAAILVCASSLAMPYWRENFRHERNDIAAQLFAGQQKDLCGLAFVGVTWWATTGYSHFHRAAPIFIYGAPADVTDSANYILTNDPESRPPSYEVRACWGALCLLRRAGACAPAGHDDFNRFLEKNES